MKKPKGIDPKQAGKNVPADQAILVSAREDEERCGKVPLDGSITMRRLKKATRKRGGSDAELILVCT